MYATSPTHEHPRISRVPVRDQIRRRMPRPGAGRRLTVSAPSSPFGDTLDREVDRVVDYTRLSGPRDDVLDYAAFLFATDTGWGPTALDLVAIEEDGERLTVVLGKPL